MEKRFTLMDVTVEEAEKMLEEMKGIIPLRPNLLLRRRTTGRVFQYRPDLRPTCPKEGPWIKVSSPNWGTGTPWTSPACPLTTEHYEVLPFYVILGAGHGTARPTST